jgi:hypothetical protein
MEVGRIIETLFELSYMGIMDKFAVRCVSWSRNGNASNKNPQFSQHLHLGARLERDDPT